MRKNGERIMLSMSRSKKGNGIYYILKPLSRESEIILMLGLDVKTDQKYQEPLKYGSIIGTGKQKTEIRFAVGHVNITGNLGEDVLTSWGEAVKDVENRILGFFRLGIKGLNHRVIPLRGTRPKIEVPL